MADDRRRGGRHVFFPSGSRREFTLSGASNYRGQASQLYLPPSGYGERLHQVGDLWYLVMPGAVDFTFERVVLPDSTVIYHPRSARDSRSNVLTFATDAAARITGVSDSVGNAISLTYASQVTNRLSAVPLHTITTPPVVGWNEVVIPAGQSFRWIQAVSAPNAFFDVSEVEFYESDGSGGYTKLNGSRYGTDPGYGNNPSFTHPKAFDGSTSTRFKYCRPNLGITGMDLGFGNTAVVTKIRYFISSTFSGDLGKFAGMRFEGMVEQPETTTVLASVSATTGYSVEFDYGTHFDDSVGQTFAVLENVLYRNPAGSVTYEAAITWVTSQEGTGPSILRSREPRSNAPTPDVAFTYFPGHVAVKGQVSSIKDGTPGSNAVILSSTPNNTHVFTAPDGGQHSIVDNTLGRYRPVSTTDAVGKTTAYEWSNSLFLASRTTPAGTTSYTRNALGQPLTVTHPDGLVETRTYDNLGRLLTHTRAAAGFPSRTTTYTRNSAGRVTKITYPDGSFEDYTYNGLGLVATVREKNGSYTKYGYINTVGAPNRGLILNITRGLASATATTGGEKESFTYHLPGNPSGSPIRHLATRTDPRGRVTSYEHDYAGRVTKTTWPDGSFRQVTYDDLGNKISEFDGITIEEWTHDSFRRPLSHTVDAAPAGLNLTTTYDYGLSGTPCTCYGSGGPTLITSPAGRKTRRIYDLKGRLIEETRGYLTVDAATTSHTRDVLGRITATTDPDGYQTTYTHDSMGRVLTTTLDPAGLNLTTASTYSPFGDTLSTTAPGGRSTGMLYDKMSRPVTITDPLGTVTSITYDLGGRRTRITEAFGTALARTTHFDHDLFDRLTGTTYPDNTTTEQTYHPGGDPHVSTDELGRTTTSNTVLSTWTDSLGQSWTSFARTTLDPGGFTTTAYGPPMALTAGTSLVLSPAGRMAESHRDAAGRTIRTRSGLVTATSGLTADVSDTVMTHDPDGLMLTSTIDPAGLNLTTTYTYDFLGRTQTSEDPLNRITAYTYDNRGNLTKTKLADNREHLATYDSLSRRLTATDPENQTITYGYWYETGQTLTLKDARNFTTQWSYNLRGQILTKTYPNGDDHAYFYDALGRIRTHTTPKNEVCTYDYDVRDRQLRADWNTATPDTVRTYYGNGMLKSVDNGVSKSDYFYNSRNLLTSEVLTLAGRAARTVAYDYDADGLRTDLVYPGTHALEYAWTARAQLHSVVAGTPPPLATYTYDKAGRNTGVSHENGITQQKTWDAASQLLANTHLKGSIAVSGHGYTLDSTGRRTGESFADGSTPARIYGYDDADQVTSATYGGGQSDSYDYDPMGNRTTASIASLGGGTVNYGTANNVNQYTSVTGLTPIAHDANGNLLLQNGVSYAWDSENRLLSVTPGSPALGDKSLVHTYDGQHRRVTRTVREWTAGGWQSTSITHFIYDGWNVIEEYELTTTTSTLVRSLTWGTDLSGSLQGAGGVGGLLMVEEIGGGTATAYHFHYDGNGNVTEITDSLGDPAASYRYDAFGNTLVATGGYASQNRYRFSTKPLDGEVTNAPLYYYGYRYYDPVTGRWPSRDPIEESGGVNLYLFSYNRTIDSFDYLGLEVSSYGCDGVKEMFEELEPQIGQNSSPLEKLLWSLMKVGGCEKPEVKCCCCDRDHAEHTKDCSVRTATTKGDYTPSPRGGVIRLCRDRHKDSKELESTLYHELWHAYQSCGKGIVENPNIIRCDLHICKELQAYWNAAVSYPSAPCANKRNNPSEFRKCIVQHAVNSAKGHQSCAIDYMNDIAQMHKRADDLFDKCAKPGLPAKP
jgi:RHS repeat-associated protein